MQRTNLQNEQDLAKHPVSWQKCPIFTLCVTSQNMVHCKILNFVFCAREEDESKNDKLGEKKGQGFFGLWILCNLFKIFLYSILHFFSRQH